MNQIKIAKNLLAPVTLWKASKQSPTEDKVRNLKNYRQICRGSFKSFAQSAKYPTPIPNWQTAFELWLGFCWNFLVERLCCHLRSFKRLSLTWIFSTQFSIKINSNCAFDSDVDSGRDKMSMKWLLAVLVVTILDRVSVSLGDEDSCYAYGPNAGNSVYPHGSGTAGHQLQYTKAVSKLFYSGSLHS